jgi:hypothetical protein
MTENWQYYPNGKRSGDKKPPPAPRARLSVICYFYFKFNAQSMSSQVFLPFFFILWLLCQVPF